MQSYCCILIGVHPADSNDNKKTNMTNLILLPTLSSFVIQTSLQPFFSRLLTNQKKAIIEKIQFCGYFALKHTSLPLLCKILSKNTTLLFFCQYFPNQFAATLLPLTYFQKKAIMRLLCSDNSSLSLLCNFVATLFQIQKKANAPKLF